MPASMKHLADLDKLDVSGVLARWSEDDQYYRVKVLECNKKKRKCKVQFEDEAIHWLDSKEIHLQFSPEKLPESKILCCVCDEGHSDVPNEIIMCDTCEQGYHIQCHEPPVDRDQIMLGDEDTTWFCSTCLRIQENAEAISPDDTTSTKQAKSIKTEDKRQPTTIQAVAAIPIVAEETTLEPTPDCLFDLANTLAVDNRLQIGTKEFADLITDTKVSVKNDVISVSATPAQVTRSARKRKNTSVEQQEAQKLAISS